KNRYIGIPFKHNGRDREGIDCLGLIYLYLNEHGINIPDNDGKKIAEDWYNSEPLRFHKGLLNFFKKVENKPQKFDVLLFNINGKPKHAGVMINSEKFLHSRKNRRSAIHRLDYWRKKLYGIYRYRR
ncbi:MAG: C40 family peptidase, partial [Halanaerobiales bacterium]